MSESDWERDGTGAQRFVGAPLAVSLPTNSIKLMVDRARHREQFIWIDPPWELRVGTGVVTSSAEYPHHEAPDYPARHTAWCAVVTPLLDGAVVERIASRGDGVVEFRFQSGVIIIALDGGERDDDQWYDDWYVKP